MTIRTNDLIQVLSGDFLTDRYPADWETMEDFELDEFINEHVWEPFEQYSSSEVASLIASAASSVVAYLTAHGVEVRDF